MSRQQTTTWPAPPAPVIPVDGEYRVKCSDCGKLMLKGRMAPGSSVEIKCTRCGTMNRLFYPKQRAPDG